MWTPHDMPPPIEKIRKAQWTVENTRQTQRTVELLRVLGVSLHHVLGRYPDEIKGAVERFKQLDKGVK